jgi:hypothetical protein
MRWEGARKGPPIIVVPSHGKLLGMHQRMRIRLLKALTICVAGMAECQGTTIQTIYTDKAAFVAAVGSQPLGQQNFQSLAVGAIDGFASGAAFTGDIASRSPINTGQALESNFQSISAQVEFSFPANTTYFGFDYAFNPGVSPDVAIQGLDFNGSASPLPLNLNGGFFGIISNVPINNPSVCCANVFVDNVLYAQGPGISASNPLYPDSGACTSSVGNGAECTFITFLGPVLAFIDPPTANAYTYQILNGSHFTSLSGFPSGFAAPFDVSSNGIDYGHFAPGQTLTFPTGVTTFTISGISPAVDGSSPTAFPVQVGTDAAGANIQLTAFDSASAVPEPSSSSLVLTGLALLLGQTVKRKDKSRYVARLKAVCGLCRNP